MSEEISAGDFVKLMFYPSRLQPGHSQSGRHAFPESMWVMVTDAAGATLIGTLANEPICCSHLKCGDTVNFRREDVIAIEGQR
jgi:uncharacterized protein YegJ (DUF2314 family)